MSWSSSAWSRRSVLLLALAPLAGCGFRPLNAPRGTQAWDPDLAAIAVAPISDRPGQILQLALRESLNPGGQSVPPRWHLATVLTVTRNDLNIQRNATSTSSEIQVIANFTISDVKTGAVLYTSFSRAIGDFDFYPDAYATQVASLDARDRALKEVADEMTLRMALFVRQQRAKAASGK